MAAEFYIYLSDDFIQGDLEILFPSFSKILLRNFFFIIFNFINKIIINFSIYSSFDFQNFQVFYDFILLNFLRFK